MMSTVLVIAYFSPSWTMFHEAMAVKDVKKKDKKITQKQCIRVNIILQAPVIIKLERE